jgi:hypothetical protein
MHVIVILSAILGLAILVLLGLLGLLTLIRQWADDSPYAAPVAPPPADDYRLQGTQDDPSASMRSQRR